MRDRSTQLAGTVRDRAIASNCTRSSSPIEISITRRVATIVTRHQVQDPARLQHVGGSENPPTTGWFHGIDVLVTLGRVDPSVIEAGRRALNNVAGDYRS